jgi:hypothetical protein
MEKPAGEGGLSGVAQQVCPPASLRRRMKPLPLINHKRCPRPSTCMTETTRAAMPMLRCDGGEVQPSSASFQSGKSASDRAGLRPLRALPEVIPARALNEREWFFAGAGRLPS